MNLSPREGNGHGFLILRGIIVLDVTIESETLMKKIIVLLLLSVLTMSLVACQTPPTTDTGPIAHIIEHLEEAIPQQINQSFDLPTYASTQILWTVGDTSLDALFVYAEPFFDKEITINVEITHQNTTYTHTFTRQLIARDSALNVSTLYIETATTDPIERRSSQDITFRLVSTQNGHTQVVFETDQAQIRGRGNSTWDMPKKPYRIRFREAVSILDLPESRTYVLLAEYADKSLLRNTIVHKFSSRLEHLSHTITTRVVELYLNGEYQGIYTFTEQVELAPSKLSFESIPGVLDTGYFLELDQRFFDKGGVAGLDGLFVSGYPYELIRPDPTHPDFTLAQLAFIQQHFLDMEAALIAQSGYEDYLDIDNWIDYFIVQELFKNVDVGWSSVYIYKKAGESLRLGPLWDFDLAIGNADYIDYAPENWYGMRAYKNRWFQLMMAIPEVREQFKLRYLELYEDDIPEMLEAVSALGDAMSPLAQRNFDRWDILAQYVWPNPPGMVGSSEYASQVEYVHNFIQRRAAWMAQEVRSDAFAQGRFEP